MPHAAFDLAQLMVTGEGGRPEPQAGRILLLQAAELGHPLALATLARMYSGGDTRFGKAGDDPELAIELVMEVARIGTRIGRHSLIQLAEEEVTSLDEVPATRREQARAEIASWRKEAQGGQVHSSLQ